MIEHKIAQGRVIHDHGCVPEPQHKSSHKIIFYEWNQGRTAVPKQHK